MENPQFHLQGIVREHDSMQDFEGPLSLILMLLQKNKIEIRDLSVSDILDQYLEYLSQMQNPDLEVSSEFVQMASHLLYLKTRMLLTAEEEISELELLKQSLEQLQARDRFAALATVLPELKSASDIGLLYLTKAPEPVSAPKESYVFRHDPVELLKAVLDLWTRSGPVSQDVERSVFAALPRRIVYSVREKGNEILHGLRSGAKSINDLYRQCRSESEIVATFIAVLELCRIGALLIEKQDDETLLAAADEYTDTAELLNSIEEDL